MSRGLTPPSVFFRTFGAFPQTAIKKRPLSVGGEGPLLMMVPIILLQEFRLLRDGDDAQSAGLRHVRGVDFPYGRRPQFELFVVVYNTIRSYSSSSGLPKLSKSPNL